MNKFLHYFVIALVVVLLNGCSESSQQSSVLAQHKVVMDGTELDFNDQILYLVIVLELYRSHVGHYPTEAQGLMALKEKPDAVPEGGEWKGPYAESVELFKDPWGRNIHYALEDGVINLRSLGKDGELSGDDLAASEMYPDVFREMKKLSEAGALQQLAPTDMSVSD